MIKLKQIIFVGMFWAQVARAADLPFGANALPHLAAEASLITQTREAQVEFTTEPGMMVYRVLRGDVIRGGNQTPQTVLVGCPVELAPPAEAEFTNAIMFAFGPLDREQLEAWGLDPQLQVYQLVGDRYGVIDATNQRLVAIQEYLRTSEGEGQKQWINKYLKTEDEFLQRSAVVAVEPQLTTPDAIALLTEAVRSDTVDLENRRLALQLLASSESAAALGAIREVAQETKAPESLRVAAVSAIASMSGGMAQIEVWSRGNDPVLSPAAKEIQASAASKQQSVEMAPSAILEQLKSPVLMERLEAAESARRAQPSEELLEGLRLTIFNPQEKGVVKVAAMESLGILRVPSAMRILESSALDQKQDIEARKAAVMAIARMNTEEAAAILRRIASSVQEPEIQKLAKGLAESQ